MQIHSENSYETDLKGLVVDFVIFKFREGVQPSVKPPQHPMATPLLLELVREIQDALCLGPCAFAPVQLWHRTSMDTNM